jgi:hypothetical protein
VYIRGGELQLDHFVILQSNRGDLAISLIVLENDLLYWMLIYLVFNFYRHIFLQLLCRTLTSWWMILNALVYTFVIYSSASKLYLYAEQSVQLTKHNGLWTLSSFQSSLRVHPILVFVKIIIILNKLELGKCRYMPLTLFGWFCISFLFFFFLPSSKTCSGYSSKASGTDVPCCRHTIARVKYKNTERDLQI